MRTEAAPAGRAGGGGRAPRRRRAGNRRGRRPTADAALPTVGGSCGFHLGTPLVTGALGTFGFEFPAFPADPHQVCSVTVTGTATLTPVSGPAFTNVAGNGGSASFTLHFTGGPLPPAIVWAWTPHCADPATAGVVTLTDRRPVGDQCRATGPVVPDGLWRYVVAGVRHGGPVVPLVRRRADVDVRRPRLLGRDRRWPGEGHRRRRHAVHLPHVDTLPSSAPPPIPPGESGSWPRTAGCSPSTVHRSSDRWAASP